MFAARRSTSSMLMRAHHGFDARVRSRRMPHGYARARMDLSTEPVRGADPDISLLGMSGVERIRVGAGRLMPSPPVHHLTGFRPVEGGKGWSSFELPASPWFQSFRGGQYLAGISAIVADAPLGGAVMSVQEPGCLVTSS